MLRYELISVAGCQVLAPVVEWPQSDPRGRNDEASPSAREPESSRRIWLETLPYDGEATDCRGKSLSDKC